MPDCTVCPILEAVRQSRVNAATTSDLLQAQLDALEALPEPTSQERESTLLSLAVRQGRANHQRDYCDRLAALVGVDLTDAAGVDACP